MFTVKISDQYCDSFIRDYNNGGNVVILKFIFNTKQIDDWCSENNVFPIINNKDELYYPVRKFKNEKDAILFALRWS